MKGVAVALERDGCGAAIRWASSEARLHHARLLLVHPWDLPLDVCVDLDEDALPDLCGPATCVGASGSLHSVLGAQDVDMVVFAGPDTRRATRTYARHARTVVVTVPRRDSRVTGRIVVGVCGTVASRAALTWGARECQLRGADLVVVQAWQVHPATARHLLQPARAVSEQQETVDARLGAWVRDAIGPQVPELHAVHGGPLDRLLEAGADADMIVLGRQPHGPFGQFVHGSIGDGLTKLAPCPVVVVPSSIGAA